MKKTISCLMFITCWGFIFSAGKAQAAMAVDLQDITITPNRLAQKDYKISGNVTVITKDQIEASNSQSIPDILKESLGVYVTDNSTAKSSIIDIRGFGDTSSRNILVLINGRKINPIDISAPDLIQIPVEAVERIEIIRGSGSVLYGDNAVGGVVNIVTKKGEGNLKGRIGSTYGSYDAQTVDMEVQGYKNNISYYMYSKYNDQRGYRDNSDLLAKDFQGRFAYDFSEKISADLNVGWHKDVQELPGGLTGAQMESQGRKASAYPNDIAYTTDRFVQLELNLEPWPEDEYFGNFVLDFHYRNRDVYDEFNSFSPFHTKRSIDTQGITGKYIFDRRLFNREVNFVTGIDYYDHENDILGSGSNVDDITISKEEFGIFGFLQYELFEKLFVNSGTRYHQAEYAFSQRNVAVDQKERPDTWVSMGGLKYEYEKGSNIHLNVQQNFRFLSTDEWYSTANFPGFGITPGLNLGLDQQEGIQYETGVKHNFDNKALLSVTGYYLGLKNEIFFDPVTFANSNYDKTRRVGVEVGTKVDILEFFNWEFLNRLEFFSNYTYQDAEFVDGNSDGKQIPMAPEHQSSHGIIIEFLEKFNFSLIGRYVGSRFAINDVNNETARAKPYYVLDGKVAFKMKNFETFIAINNMANEEYSSVVSKSTTSSTKNYFPAPERNYTFGVSFKF